MKPRIKRSNGMWLCSCGDWDRRAFVAWTFKDAYAGWVRDERPKYVIRGMR